MPCVQCTYLPPKRLRFLTAMMRLHQLNIEAVALVYVPKTCAFTPEPSNGNHYTLLPLTGDPKVCIGPLLTFSAAKLAVVSKHGRGNMGIQLKLPPNFSLQLNGSDLSDEPAFSHGPIWRNEEFIVCGHDNQPLIMSSARFIRTICTRRIR